MSGETNVSVDLVTGDVPQVKVSLYPDRGTRFEAAVLSDGVPLLMIEHGPTQVRLWPHLPTKITASDVAAAQRLVESATAYLAALERLHTDQADQAA
jgi:hypothetical protein